MSAAVCDVFSVNADSLSGDSIIAVMNSLPREIYSVATVRDIDRTAIDDWGVPGYTLMQRAGAFAVRAAQEKFPRARRWLVLCGAGNNAGDGYVVALLAAREGIKIEVVAVSEPDTLRGDAALAYRDFVAGGGRVSPWSGVLDSTAELIVDAMLGTGLQRPVAGDFASAVDGINAAAASVLALDIPTGLHGDTGVVMGRAVRADLTTTFVGLKQGLFLGDAASYCGEIYYSDLDIDPDCFAGHPVEYQRVAYERIGSLLPRRQREAHKGDFGRVLLVGGGRGMPGAILLAGEAALRAGAGRVTIATDPAHATEIVRERPELMVYGVAGVADLDALLANADVIGVGPGIGRSAWANELLKRAQSCDLPAVWDADGLNWLVKEPNVAENRIITPHPGEAASLLGIRASAVQKDRREALRQLQARYGGVTVLKGAGSLISSVTGAPWLCTAGNPGMATAGMGDVLTGVIAGLLAQGLSLQDAAVVGVELHSRAGDQAARAGERGLIASDLFVEIRRLLNDKRVTA